MVPPDYFTVYVLTTKPSVSPIETFFSNAPTGSIFKKPPVRIATPVPTRYVDTKINACGRRSCTGCRKTHAARPATVDYEIFRAVVEHYSQSGGNGGVVIVKDTTVTNVTIELVESAFDSANTALLQRATSEVLDIFYFAKWLDIPNKFEHLDSLDGGGHVVKTWSPHGVQAIAITKAGLTKLLRAFPPDTKPVVCRPFSEVINITIQNGALIAATTTPSLMQYDTYLTGDAIACSDTLAPYTYLKSCEARGDIGVDKPMNRRISSGLSMFLFIIVIILTFITSWTLVNLGAIVV